MLVVFSHLMSLMGVGEVQNLFLCNFGITVVFPIHKTYGHGGNLASLEVEPERWQSLMLWIHQQRSTFLWVKGSCTQISVHSVSVRWPTKAIFFLWFDSPPPLLSKGMEKLKTRSGIFIIGTTLESVASKTGRSRNFSSTPISKLWSFHPPIFQISEAEVVRL